VTPTKYLVLDANILIRGVLGTRVRRLLRVYADSISFLSPDVCFADAERHLPRLSADPSYKSDVIRATFEEVSQIVESVDRRLYEEHEAEARRRIRRDPSDWPIVATAMLLNCPVWTEDQDFFGSGLPIWTTNNVEVYLRER
jgi:predicted nucleic acid-binding protein